MPGRKEKKRIITNLISRCISQDRFLTIFPDEVDCRITPGLALVDHKFFGGRPRKGERNRKEGPDFYSCIY